MSEYLQFAMEIARAAGEITLNYFGKSIDVDRKGDASPVTVADREAETAMREAIEARYPSHGILGEEHGSTRPEADFQWILDPIDGTKSFIRGVPLYGVLVALEEKGESRVGVIYHPPQDELIAAEAGSGCWLNGERAEVSDADDPRAECILTTSHVDFWQRRPEFTIELMKRYPLQREWGDCYGYSMVATGRAQAMLDPEMSRWDIAALKPIIEEAGGVFTDLNGVPTARGEHAIAATPKLHGEIMELLERCPSGA